MHVPVLQRCRCWRSLSSGLVSWPSHLLAAPSSEPGQICGLCPSSRAQHSLGDHVPSFPMPCCWQWAIKTLSLCHLLLRGGGQCGPGAVLLGGHHAWSIAPGDLLPFSHRFKIISCFLGAGTADRLCAAALGWLRRVDRSSLSTADAVPSTQWKRAHPAAGRSVSMPLLCLCGTWGAGC